MSQPKISIVTPSFNQAGYLEETLHSIFNQRYPNLELIVVDGGSTDGSVEIIKKYADRFAWWVSERDSGQTEAINKGMRRVSGEIVGYLNSDDVLLPGALLRVAEEFRKNSDCRWLTGRFVFFGDEPEQNFEHPVDVPKHAGGWFGRDPIAQPSTFWRADVTKQHGLFDESYRFGMDYEYWVRIVTAGEKCHFVDYPISGYRLHNSSKTVAMADRFAADNQRIRDTYMPRLSWLDKRRAHMSICFEACKPHYTAARELIRQHRKLAAFQQLMRTVVQYPTTMTTKWCLGTISRLILPQA
jgi:glycosyltransferase involved in cell wall biosynthesis